MRWNSKTEIISFLLSLLFPLTVVVIGCIASMIINIKYGGLDSIAGIFVLLGLIGCAVYFLRCINKKNKKTKN